MLSFILTFGMVVPSSRAEASCTVPNTISNGQVADATAVMGNFTALNNCVNLVVSPSGNPAAGNLGVFSGPNTITDGDLSGDCTTSGSLVLTCTKSNGVPLGPFATGTDGGQLTGTFSVNRFGNGVNADSTHFLRGDGTWATPPGGTGTGGGGTMPVVRASSIQSSSASSFTVTWPTGTVAGDVVVIFGEAAYGFTNPVGWAILDHQSGSYANGFTVAKVMTAADISAGSVTITVGGSYNCVLAAVTVDGSTLAGLHTPGVFLRSSSGPGAGSAVGLSSSTPNTTDLIIAFMGVRAASTITYSGGFTSLSSINASNASGNVAKFTGSLEVLGLNETATSGAAGTGYYSAVVIFR